MKVSISQHRIRFILLVLLLPIASLLFAQKKQNSRVLKVDTIYKTDTVYVKKVIVDEEIKQSEYFVLFEKLLEQKQQNYDSSLNLLNWIASILALVFAIVITAGVILGFNEFRQIKQELRTQLAEKKEEIESALNEKLLRESEKIANDLITKKYEEDITELKEKTSNLETLSKEILESYVLRFDKKKPKILDSKTNTKTIENPFDKK